jgi:hypothetical protein
MPVRISGPATAAASVPAKITIAPSVLSVRPAENQPVTITLLDASGNPIFDQEVRVTATGDVRFVRGDGATNTVTNGRTNEKGQLVVTVTMAGSTTGTITAIPDTGQASLKATATVSSYRLGELGPGDGLVFLIADGKTYEMASRPRNDAVPNSKCISIDVDPNCFLPDPKAIWCDKASSSLPGTGTEVGTGRKNTALMTIGGCIAGAHKFAANRVSGGWNDWFLPSSGELAAMESYTRTCVNGCFFHERFAFNETKSVESLYWSSSQYAAAYAWNQSFSSGLDGYSAKDRLLRVRPIRSF